MIRRFILLLVALTGLFVTGCQEETSGQAQQEGKAVTVADKPVINLLPPAQFEQKVQEVGTAQLVDLRTPKELASGILPEAHSIIYGSNDFQSQLEKLDKSKPVLIYCAVGGRSGQVARLMAKMGFQEVYDLKGGIVAWRNEGKALVKP